MSSTLDQKNQAIRYWERRRPAYNLLLVLPALAGFLLRGEVPAGVGDQVKVGMVGIVVLFALSAIGANICYSFAYVLEFWLLTESGHPFWTKRGRSLVFVAGCLLAVSLAFVGGMQIAIIEYYGLP